LLIFLNIVAGLPTVISAMYTGLPSGMGKVLLGLSIVAFIVFIALMVIVYSNWQNLLDSLDRTPIRAYALTNKTQFTTNADIRETLSKSPTLKGYFGQDIQEVKDKLKSYFKNTGVHLYLFFRTYIPIFNIRINYRDHRKVTIIDNRVAFVGGMNIGDEYLGKGKIGYWRDTSVKIFGDIVSSFEKEFYFSMSIVKNKFFMIFQRILNTT